MELAPAATGAVPRQLPEASTVAGWPASVTATGWLAELTVPVKTMLPPPAWETS
jgi:hypothetical protein